MRIVFLFFTELTKPENLTIVSITFTSITVTWDPPANSNGEVLNYRIQVVNIKAPYSLVTLENTTETTHTVSGLLPSTEYGVTVKVFTSAGSGPGANESVITKEVDVEPLLSKPICPRVCMRGCMCCVCTVGLYVLCVYSRFVCIVCVQ